MPLGGASWGVRAQRAFPAQARVLAARPLPLPVNRAVPCVAIPPTLRAAVRGRGWVPATSQPDTGAPHVDRESGLHWCAPGLSPSPLQGSLAAEDVQVSDLPYQLLPLPYPTNPPLPSVFCPAIPPWGMPRGGPGPARVPQLRLVAQAARPLPLPVAASRRSFQN